MRCAEADERLEGDKVLDVDKAAGVSLDESRIVVGDDEVARVGGGEPDGRVAAGENEVVSVDMAEVRLYFGDRQRKEV